MPPKATGPQPETEMPDAPVMVTEELASSAFGSLIPKVKAWRYEVPLVAVSVPVLKEPRIVVVANIEVDEA